MMLDAEVLDKIQPFNGFNQPQSDAGQIIAGGGTMQQVKTAYTTAVAVQKPRSITRVAHNVLQEAGLAGASFYYRWTVKDKNGELKIIQGPSVDLAMCIARNYGNCVIDVEANETPTHYMLKGILIDLESGFTCPRLFRQRKSQGIGGKFDKDRQEDIVFQIGQSKAIRNAIVRAMPAWLVDQAIEVAQGAELKQIKPENINKARANVMQFFSTYGVTQDRIEAKVGRAADEWTAQDIVDLRGNATALKEGRVAPEVLFPPVETADQKQDPPQGASGPGGNQASTESGPDPEPPPPTPEKNQEPKEAGQPPQQQGKSTARQAQDLLESMHASYSSLGGDQPPRVRTFRHNGQAYTCTSCVSSGKDGIIHLDAWRLIPERSYKGTQWDYHGLLKLWDAGQRERGDKRGMQVLLGDNLLVLADALRFYPDREPQRIHLCPFGKGA